MNLDSVHPIWLGIAILVAMAIKCSVQKRWPTEREFVELVALSGGLVAAIIMGCKCVVAKDGYEPWVLLTGSALTGLVSVRGVWRIFTQKDQTVDPKK